MKIAIIGTGNVGGALASVWSGKDHTINLGVKDLKSFKGSSLLNNSKTKAFSVKDAMDNSDVILIATPPEAVFDILKQAGDLNGKTVIDATNSISKKLDPYTTVYHCVSENSKADTVKCFNTTGYENMLNPVYLNTAIDMFMAGDSENAKSIASELALDAGFASCIDFGKSDKVELLEKFALSWINLAIMQGLGRDIAFKLLRR